MIVKTHIAYEQMTMRISAIIIDFLALYQYDPGTADVAERIPCSASHASTLLTRMAQDGLITCNTVASNHHRWHVVTNKTASKELT